MKHIIDIKYDVRRDTPPGKDPDSHSATLRRYHQILWSKKLPNGKIFDLDNKLHHKSELGEFWLSSDGIGITLTQRTNYQHIICRAPKDEIDEFYSLCFTVGAFLVFPGNRINNKWTINQARGMSSQISDRTDLTFECIRLYYLGEESPLYDCLCRYKDFFDLFVDFKGYVDYFLMQDIVNDDYSIKYWHPFTGFDNLPLPATVEEYMTYKDRVTEFVINRNNRIEQYINF